MWALDGGKWLVPRSEPLNRPGKSPGTDGIVGRVGPPARQDV